MTRDQWDLFWARWDAWWIPISLWLSRVAAVGAGVAMLLGRNEAAIFCLVVYVWLTVK